MERIYTSIRQLSGNTPLLALTNIEKEMHLCARLLAKVEGMNPAGSVKDRAALAMIRAAEEQGILQKGAVIIEPTSGNTGIGIAAIAAASGYKAVIVMPDTMSIERQQLLKAYGAEVVLTPGKLGMQGAIDKAKALAAENPGSFIPDQFGNPANPSAHYETTGPEIWRDTCGNVDFFVAGVGTGGTITGVGRYLKEQDSGVQIVAVEPADSPLLSRGISGAHGLQGIGANFVPSLLDQKILDGIVTVTQDQAHTAGRLLAHKEGILCGISSGAALSAAIDIAQREENAEKTVVVLLPDTGERYLSTPMFADQ